MHEDISNSHPPVQSPANILAVQASGIDSEVSQFQWRILKYKRCDHVRCMLIPLFPTRTYTHRPQFTRNNYPAINPRPVRLIQMGSGYPTSHHSTPISPSIPVSTNTSFASALTPACPAPEHRQTRLGNHDTHYCGGHRSPSERWGICPRCCLDIRSRSGCLLEEEAVAVPAHRVEKFGSVGVSDCSSLGVFAGLIELLHTCFAGTVQRAVGGYAAAGWDTADEY